MDAWTHGENRITTSRDLRAALRRAVTARRDWNDARAAANLPRLHPIVYERARNQAQMRFHEANELLARVVCQELGVSLPDDDPGSVLPVPTRRPIAHSTPEQGPLAIVRRLVKRARAVYLATNARDAHEMALARSAYLTALIEYFDVREQASNERSEAAE